MIRLPAMFRFFALLLILFPLLLTAPGVRAQSAQDAPPVPASLTPAQAQQVLDVLRDSAKRQQFINVLESMAKALPPPASPVAASPIAAAAAQPPLAPPAHPAPAPAPPSAAPHAAAAAPTAAGVGIPLAPDSLGAEILVGASNRLEKLSREVVTTAQVLTDFPLIERWIDHLVRNRDARAEVLQALWKLAVIMAVAVAGERAAVRLLHHTITLLADRAPPAAIRQPGGDDANAPAPDAAGNGRGRRRRTAAPMLLLRRLPYVLARLALDLVPILLLIAIGYAMLSTPLGAPDTTRLVVLAVLNAYVLSRLVVMLTRVVLAPHTPRLRLVNLSDAAAWYILRWVRRIAIIAIFGYAVAEVGLLFGLYRVAHDALLKLVSLAVHICLVVIVLQTRRRIAEVIRGRADATGPTAQARKRLAAVWHIIAIFYLMALWLVSALEVEDGYARLVRIFISTVIVASAARLATVSANNALERAVRVPPEVSTRYPGLEMRVRRYHPVARSIVGGMIAAVAFVVLFEAWGVDSFSWFRQGELGGRLLSALVDIGLTLLGALLAWEVANAAMQRRLLRQTSGAQAARMRTLLPMLRTALLVSICLVAGLIVLSDIGVNIAPLLAGAGVVGIAIGFGSQKLVQDLITGLFLLMENAMQVGDWVTVSGLSGAVEQLSIRTIRLRASDGSVHIIPFSSVTSVTNVNRGIGNASVGVSVAYGEDIDRVCTVLADIAKGMRTDQAFAPGMKTDLQLWGVDKVEAGGVTIVGQIVCTDSARWGVQREFNRRMQLRFAELGIRLAVPVQRLTVETVPAEAPAQPAAPPAAAAAAAG